MRIYELIVEQQPVGTVGSSTSPTSNVGTVSNTPSNTSGNTSATGTSPEVTKLAATLKNKGVIGNEKEINDFLGAYQAQQSKKTLNPQQQASMAKLAGALMTDRSLSTNLDLQIKAMSQQKPGQPTAQTSPAG